MNTKRNILSFVCIVAATVALSLSPAPGAAGAYSLSVAGERLEFVSQPERGYVVKLPERPGGLYALAGTYGLDTKNAKPIGGLDRHGVWTVKNAGPAGRNEKTIRSLRSGGRVTYAAPLFSSNGETVAVIPEIVIRVRPGVDARQVHFLCESLALAVVKPMEFTEQEYLLEVLGPDAEAVFAAVEQLGQAPEVEWACPNTAFWPKLAGQGVLSSRVPNDRLVIASAGQDANDPGVFPNDEYFPMQWHLHNTGQSGGTLGADIRAPEAWEITTGDPNVIVAVVDGGVDLDHPDLVNNLVPGYDFYQYDDVPEPSQTESGPAHGTSCAGLVAAQGDNGIGVTGVTWNCGIMPIRAYIWGAYGATPQSDVATAFRWAAAHGADVLSNSWGELDPQPIIHSAIVDITKPGGMGRSGKGCVVVFAAGNNGGPVLPPAKYPEVIAVGAVDKNDQIWWSYSGRGPDLDVVAPSGYDNGGDIWTTDLVGLAGWNNRDSTILDYTDSFGGTSGACPVAAGVAALILSIEPNLTNDEVRHFLEQSAKDLGDPGWDGYYGWGRVDARAALDMVLAKRADLNSDGKVDEQDLAILNAAVDTNDLSADIAPAAKRDGVVDEQDLDLLMQYSGTEIPEFGLFGLLAHWKLDETEGVVAHDSAGHNDATVIGVPVWQPEGGMVGGALQLDGVDDYVETPHLFSPADGPFSVFAWVREGTPGQVVVSQAFGTHPSLRGANWLLADPSTGALRTDLKGSGRDSHILCSQTMITDGSWHRVGLVRDGDNRTLYVDDIVAAQDTQSGGPVGCYEDLKIGCGKDMAPGTFWNGLVDDVQIYYRAVKP